MSSEDPIHPSERLVTYLKERLRECRCNIEELRADVKACQKLAEESSTKEDEAVRRLSDMSSFQETMSELQALLYEERGHALGIKRDKDQLELENFENKKKIAYLLQVAGMKESQLSFEDRARRILAMSPRKRVRFKELKNFNKMLEDFKEESLIEILDMKTELLETELKEQTTLLRDQLVSQTADIELRKREWEVQKKALTQQVASLNFRLRNALTFTLSGVRSYIDDLEEVRERDVKLIEENDKLKRSLAICKELLKDSEDEETAKRKDECLKDLKEEVERRDRLVREYAARNDELTDHLRLTKRELEREKEVRQNEKERYARREEYFKKKLEEEKKRRLLDAEGFTADVKLLRSKLQSVERCIRLDQLRRRHRGDT